MASHSVDRRELFVTRLCPGSRLAVGQHFTLVVIGKRFVGQETRHAERGIGRKNAEHRGELGLDPVATIKRLGQVLGCLVPERVTNDDEGTLTVGAGNMRPDGFGVEVLLGREIFEGPFVEEPCVQEPTPFNTERLQEPLVVDLLDFFREGLEEIPALTGRGLGLLAKAPVEPVELIEALLIRGEEIAWSFEAEGVFVFDAKGEDLGSRNDGVIRI